MKRRLIHVLAESRIYLVFLAALAAENIALLGVIIAIMAIVQFALWRLCASNV